MIGRGLALPLFAMLVSIPSLASQAEDAYARASDALKVNDLAAARKELEVCVKLEPARPEFRYAQAVVLARLSDWTSALGAVEECIRLKPNFPKAESLRNSILNSRGLDAAAHGRFAEAASDFRAIAHSQPGFAAAHYNLGLALQNLSRTAEAEEEFRTVLKIEPGHAKAQAQLATALLTEARTETKTKMREAAEAFRAAVRLDPSNPNLRHNLAFALGRLGDDTGALAEYKEVLRLAPDFPSVEFSLGFTLFLLGDYAAAEPRLRKAVSRAPGDFQAQYYLGSVLSKTGDPVSAEQHLKQAAALDPEQPGVHFQLASLYRAAGNAKAASEERQRFAELSGRQERKRRADTRQTAARLALERGNIGGGIDALTEAYREHPSATLARNIALAHLQQDHPTEAAEWLKKALATAPDDPIIYNYLGLVEARRGDLPLARQRFEKAASLDPHFAEAFYNAGVAATELHQAEDAVRLFEAAVRNDDSGRNREALALALSYAGRDRDAQREFDAAQKRR